MGLYDVTQPFISLPAPTGDPERNFNLIQQALDSRGTIYIGAAGTYEISNTLTVYSGTHVVLGKDVIIKHSSTIRNFRPLVMNIAAKTAGTTVTVTSSGTTCTVTWTNHGRKSGDFIAIAGASAETGYVGVFEVATVTSPNTFAYVAYEAPSTTPASGTVLAWVADTDISFEGGTWDYNQSELTGPDNIAKMGFLLAHTHNTVFQNVAINNVNKYAIYLVNGHDFAAHTLRFDTASDGIHMSGCTGADIQDIAGQFGDDILCFLSSQGTGSNYNLGTWMKFPHRFIEARNLRSYNSLQSGIKITGGDHPYRSIMIDGLYGAFANAPMTIFEDPPFGLLGPDIDLLVLRNIRPDVWGSTLSAVRFTVSNDSCTIRRLEIDGISGNVAGTQKMVDLRSTGTGTMTIESAVIKNVDYTAVSPSGSAGFLAVGDRGAINSLVIDGFRMAGASTNNFFMLVSGISATVTRAMISNGYTHSGNGFFVRYESNATTADVYLENVHTQLTNNPVDFRRACNLFANNWKHSGSTPVNINGTGTYILRGGVDCPTTHIAIAGGASVQVYGFDWRADPITPALSATVGQYLTSTQAAAEGGPAVLGNVGWVALGGGAAGINTIIT
jgi:hypothetical protein